MTCRTRTHSLYVWHWLARDLRDVLCEFENNQKESNHAQN